MRLQILAFVFAAVLVSPTVLLSRDATPRIAPAEFDAEIPGHAGVTGIDLARQVIPDLATGHRALALRHIAGESSVGPLPDPIKIATLRTLAFMSEGKPRIALLIGVRGDDDMGEQPALLAVFDDGRAPTLIDVVDVGTDRFTGFADPALVCIGADDDAILTVSQHFNADESYEATALIVLRGGKLGLVDTFSAYGSRTCALSTSQSFSFKAASEAGRSPYYAITVTMRDLGERQQEPCEDASAPLPYERTATTVYRWDAGKAAFHADSDAVRRLQQQTAER